MREISAELLASRADSMKADMVGFCQRLIQTKSISGEERGVADLYLAEMEALGYDETFRDDAGNVVGLVYGSEPGPTIMYNSHMDHVSEGDTRNWEGYDPYGALIDECPVDDQEKTVRETVRCLHGRAASDVKGGGAVQVYAGGLLARLKKEGYVFKGNFMFTGVVLEEAAEAIGMRCLCETTLPARGLDYDAVVSSEATSLKLYLGHRGRTEFLITTHGRTSHGSAPWLGVNAIYKAMPVIARVKDELYPALPTDPDLGQASVSLNIIECLPGALSIVPDQCMLSIDRRTIPGETQAEVTAQFQRILDELAREDPEFKADIIVKSAKEHTYTGLTLDALKDGGPWKIPKEHPFVKAAALGLEAVGQEVKYDYWVFGTDLWVNAGLCHKPSIGYSPMQEQFAHTPYDKVRIDYMEKALLGNASIFLRCGEAGDGLRQPI
ncbi:MAG: M20/M25/M40 family metallo-hydrolase [Oscillospiraceae bacterium]|nr:M20/M25/M40 family metallo-hydrolase [Oscillospiraceae bacterium]